MTTPRIEELVKELRMVANMINLGEKIRWGQETALMDEAADALEALTEAHQAGYAEGYKQGKFDAEMTAKYGEPEALQDNK